MYTILAFYTFHTAYTTVYDSEHYHTPGLPKPLLRSEDPRTDDGLKYILVWSTPEFKNRLFEEGQGLFVKNNCSYMNCYLSDEMHLLESYKKDFDVVLIDIGVIRQSLWNSEVMPQKRTARQKYLFHSMRSSDETPVCNVKADGFFNWTWSYKIYSDISTPFIEVIDTSGHVVAPRRDVRWIENMNPISKNDKKKLLTKKKAVAWIPESCKTRSNRMEFAKNLQEALKEHNLELDIYGCSMKLCPKEGCMKALERDYYFYLAYEPSHAEDYVTDEVLKAYHHNTVPIVKGGADYRYFLPEGSYINAGSGSVEKLASLIDFSIRNPSVYYSFHQWKYYYRIRKVNHNRGVCDLCAMLNNRENVLTHSNYEKFRKWWYGDLKERCYPVGAKEEKFVVSYFNDS
ncbi:unnamed protein product [Chilo suppressalis]|uniref:Fucosyltransferase n=1 Tax=Chilo suppressalis TaxID=168631 RepID=A0ABN8AR90_CHISP|nr:unnamed protein product [Chilo suppressalis]